MCRNYKLSETANESCRYFAICHSFVSQTIRKSVVLSEIRAFTKFGSTLDDKIKLSQITLNNLIELHGAKFSKNQICPQPKIALFYILNARGI